MTRRSRPRAIYVAFEGIDGAGKSTTARAVAGRLRRRGYRVRLRREPASQEIGRKAQRAARRDPWTGALYFTLDRYLARPSLERDLARSDYVLTDRSYFSTLAYQGSALRASRRSELVRMQRSATVRPDRVLLFDLPVADAVRRIGRRGGGKGPLEIRRLLARVARAYAGLAERGRWSVLDARAPRSELARRALLLLPPAPGPPRGPRRR